MRSLPGASPSLALSQAADIDGDGFALDHEFQPVTLGGDRPEAMSAGAETYVVRGTLKEDDMEQLRQRPEVMEVWLDTPIAPFQDPAEPHPQPAEQGEGMAACPIPPCDCSPGTPRGTIADVAVYLGANDIWARGFRGTGIVVGVLDGGITAQGRPVKTGETARRIPRVIGGFPADWGTEAGQWGEHGNMCATDVLGMAPDAQLYDFRIAGTGGSPGTISRALQAFQWSIDRHRIDGTPHVLTNSWGIFQETWDATYARNPNHPFTRKVVEAINEGILVLFAAGNCGDTCPDGRCGPDVGARQEHLGCERPSDGDDRRCRQQERGVRRLQQPGTGGAGSEQAGLLLDHPLHGLLHERFRHLGRDADPRRRRRPDEAGEAERDAGFDQGLL